MSNTRPQALPVVLEGIPQSLRDIPRWVLWKHHWNTTRQKWVKLPCSVLGGAAAVDRPETWCDFDTAYDTYDLGGGFDGIGFVFTGDDDIVGGDFDKCFDPDTGELSDAVAQALNTIGGYWEMSPSGRGLHFITRANLPKAYKSDAQGIELYNKGRFFTVTGRVFNGHTDISDAPETLELFISLYFPPKVVPKTQVRAVEVLPESNFFKNVNDAAMKSLGAWVPELFSEVVGYREGFRVTSTSLGRELEEDISIVPEGIVDFGVADMGDTREGKRTPIDLVIEWATPDDPLSQLSAREAAFWLCDKLGSAPAALGWKQGAAANRDGYRARTEFGNAERMLDRYGASLMYVPEIESWFKWSDVYWQKISGVELEHCAKETIRALPDEIEDLESDEERLEFFKFCAACQKASMVGNMIRLASSDPRVMVPLAELDKRTHLLGVGNGAVDLRTGQLVEPDKEHRITIISPVEYDPAARAPLFEQTVGDVFFGDNSQVTFFQRLIGYALLGRPKEDVLVIPYGGGSNGKSTVLGAVRETLGQHAKSANADTFLSSGGNSASAGSAREDVLRLRGARFVYIGEPDEGSELREGLIKSMTGGDPVPARGLYSKTTVEITPTWVAFMPTNHRPIVKGDDHAIWRRLLPVPFTRNFDKDDSVKKDTGRAERLAAEAAGILAWAVRGAVAYQADGLKTPASVSEARDTYKNDMDLLAEWIDERCSVGKGNLATADDLWRSWRVFADERGELRLISSSRALGRRLAAREFLPVRNVKGMRGRGFAGISVVAENEFADCDLL